MFSTDIRVRMLIPTLTRPMMRMKSTGMTKIMAAVSTPRSSSRVRRASLLILSMGCVPSLGLDLGIGTSGGGLEDAHDAGHRRCEKHDEQGGQHQAEDREEQR